MPQPSTATVRPPAVQRPLVRGGVDAVRHAADDDGAPLGQAPGQPAGERPPLRGGAAAADDRHDRAVGEAASASLDLAAREEPERRVVELVEPPRVAGVGGADVRDPARLPGGAAPRPRRSAARAAAAAVELGPGEREGPPQRLAVGPPQRPARPPARARPLQVAPEDLRQAGEPQRPVGGAASRGRGSAVRDRRTR